MGKRLCQATGGAVFCWFWSGSGAALFESCRRLQPALLTWSAHVPSDVYPEAEGSFHACIELERVHTVDLIRPQVVRRCAWRLRPTEAGIYTAARSILSQALRPSLGLTGEAVLFGRAFYMLGETFGWLFLDIDGQATRMPDLRPRLYQTDLGCHTNDPH